MTTYYKKIITHPDKEEIITHIVEGKKPAEIAAWLKTKYPNDDQIHLRISPQMLKDFIDNNIDLYNDLKNHIEEHKAGTLKKKISESLINNKTYRERLAELGDQEIDLKQSIKNLLHIMVNRLEQIHDVIQQNPDKIGKGDYALDKFANTVLLTIDKCDKIINNKPDQVIQHNFTVQMVEDNVAALQNAVRSVLMKMDPEQSAIFLDLLNEEFKTLKDPSGYRPIHLDQKINEVKVLEEKIINTNFNNDIDGE